VPDLFCLPLAFFEALPATLALAAGAVSIPVIIHLLNRKRFRVVTWAAMRFLLAAQRKSSRRMRLEQIILLAVRCLLVLLLLLGMASITPWAEAVWRWFAPDAPVEMVAGGQRIHKILVLDGSFSMSLRQGDGPSCFDRAREMANRIVQESGGGNGFSVVLMGSPPRRVVPEPSEDARKVLAEIDALRVTHGNADLLATLNTVESLVRASPGKYPDREVYFLTDLQQSGWIARQPAALASTLLKIQSRAHTVFLNVGGEAVSNLAVTNLTLGDALATTQREVPILVTLHNFGDTRSDVSVRLFVGRAREKATDRPQDLHEVGEVLVNHVERNQPTPVSFKYRFPTAGDYVLVVQAAHDTLEVDDMRSAVVTVKSQVPVLLVNGKPAAELYDRATEWLRNALNPFDDGSSPANVVARPRVLPLSEFADEGLGDLQPYDCVYLCDVPILTLAEVRRLEDHVRRGGSVVICLGPNVDIGSYNEMLYRKGTGLLPAQLLGKQQATAEYDFQLVLDPDADREEPLTIFRSEGAREWLQKSRFQHFVQTDPVSRAGPRRVLSFAPVPTSSTKKGTPPSGGAAILEWHPPAGKDPTAGRMRGRVVLITTTVNADWNNWPSSPTYAPLMQELLYYASAGRLRERFSQVGEPLELFLPGTSAGVEGTVSTPDGRTEIVRTEPQENGSVLRWTDTDTSGVYSMTAGQHPQQHFFAVNVPIFSEPQQGSESDLTRTSREELQKTYPEWEMQVVTDPTQVIHAPTNDGSPQVILRPLGPVVARYLFFALLVLLFLEVVLAYVFGHYSDTAPLEQPGVVQLRKWRWALAALPWLVFAAFAGIAVVLIQDRASGDFLSFLPEWARRQVESWMGVSAPAAGEGSRWRLEMTPFLWDGRSDPWLVGLLAVGGATLVWLLARREGRAGTPAARPLGQVVRSGLRLCLLLALLILLLPEVQLWFERQGWPDVVVLIDDSCSMSSTDQYRDAEVKQMADRLAEQAGLTTADRLGLAKVLLSRPDSDWLTTLLTERQVRVHVYHCSSRAHRIADVTAPEDVKGALDAIAGLSAEPANDSSQLGLAVRQVLNDFRGSSLASVIMLTDGVTTEGEDLVKVSRYARQMGVPLYFVGIGDSHEATDLYLHDLQVADSVFVHDRLVFKVHVTAQGYNGLSTTVKLREKGKDKILDSKPVNLDPAKKSAEVSLTDIPTEPGEKTYELVIDPQRDEVDNDNNRLERTVFVHESRQIKVLYIEGYRRYEYQYLKTLLERETSQVKGNKSVDVKVWLVEADADFPEEDRTAIAEFPTRAELNRFDVVILGDVDPHNKRFPRMNEHLKDLADFVRERGGGLLMVAGERYAPLTYRDTPLKDVLPIDVTVDEKPEDAEEGEGKELTESFRPEITPLGRSHPIFSFTADERENEEIWGRLREMYWHAEGYQIKRAAEVLAVHPRVRASGKTGEGKGPDRLPLMVQQFVGAGRSMFFGFDETWRWNYREDQLRFNQFWMQTVRYLARSRLGRIDLRLDRQTPYRRGEPIKVTVRFPDDAPPPPADTEVKVVVERRATAGAADSEVRTMQLAKLEGSRATFESILTQTPEGEYRFWLSQPAAPRGRPHAEARVLRPPGEMERLRMNQTDMERAADESHGRFYTLANADKLLSDLPSGTRVTVNVSGPPWLLWSHAALFFLLLVTVSTEWLLRKQANLL
jgi:uncharacterized membrane protein